MVTSSDAETLKKNYEVLVSRICKTESSLQSLKLNLASLRAERHLNREELAASGEKMSAAADAYEKELHRLGRDLLIARRENRDLVEEKTRSEEQAERLHKALRDATDVKVRLGILTNRCLDLGLI